MAMFIYQRVTITNDVFFFKIAMLNYQMDPNGNQ